MEVKDTTADHQLETGTVIAAGIGIERAHTIRHVHTATTMHLDSIAPRMRGDIETEIETATGTEIVTGIEEDIHDPEMSSRDEQGVEVLGRRKGYRSENGTFTGRRSGDRTRRIKQCL